MKRIFTILSLLAITFGFLFVPANGVSLAQDPDPREDAIVKGLEWLASYQYGDGSWGMLCDNVAYTGLAALKLASRAAEGGMDPLDPDFLYSENIQLAYDYILSQAHSLAIGLQPAGNPDGDGDGLALFWDDGCGGGHRTYNTSIALMALSSSQHPELYAIAAQDALDFLAWGQTDVGCEPHRGGWRYSDNDCNSDNSNTGWVTLALGYAQSGPPFGFGLTIPAFVNTELNPWLDVIQDDVNGDENDGGSNYDPNWTWVNILKTGNLLYEFALVGDSASTLRVQDAIDYLERHWMETNYEPGWGYGVNPANYQAMFTTMKGLDALGVDLLDLDSDGIPEHDWFAEFVAVLVAQQNPDGSWPACYWGDPIICSTWALLTLEKFVPTPTKEVAVDIKPGSCPNPLSLKDKGVLPVAILGTQEFDASQVDPTSVFLGWKEPEPNQVFAIKWKMYDAATPYVPFIGKELNRFSCTRLGADGYLDLVVYFKMPAVLSMIDPVSVGDVLILPLGGNLKAEFGGTPIRGEDVVWIVK